MKTALVLGAGGFIGSYLVHQLKEEGYWVRGADLKYPEFSRTSADDFIICDLRDPKNVEKAHAFLEKYGAKTIVLARFVPVVRTFAPIVAGVGKMNYRTFVLYNIIGGIVWGGGVTTLGYFLGEVDFVKENIEIASLAIVVLSIAPIAIEFIRHRRPAHQK